ncbi:hypothetical protein Dimus_026144 [Dionaea muscipula]
MIANKSLMEALPINILIWSLNSLIQSPSVSHHLVEFASAERGREIDRREETSRESSSINGRSWTTYKFL